MKRTFKSSLRTLPFLIIMAMAITLISSCKKESEDKNEAPQPNPAPAKVKEYFIRFKVDGKDFEVYDPGDNKTYDNFVGTGGEWGDTECTYDYGSGIQDFFNPMLKNAGLSFNHFFYKLPCGDVDEFPNLFMPGSYDYVSPDSNSYSKGVFLYGRVTDNGDFYSTYFGSGIQDNSTFTIVESIDVPNPNPLSDYKIRKLKGTFSCVFYNENNPDEALEITEGEYSLIVESNMPY